jgi:hypothetical protein
LHNSRYRVQRACCVLHSQVFLGVWMVLGVGLKCSLLLCHTSCKLQGCL